MVGMSTVHEVNILICNRVLLFIVASHAHTHTCARKLNAHFIINDFISIGYYSTTLRY